jgi:hypothetical protein
LPRFPTTQADFHRAEHLVRDLEWNPQRHLSTQGADGAAKQLVEQKERLITSEPMGKAERKAWFRQLSEFTGRLQPLTAKQLAEAKVELARREREFQANQLLLRRDYPWCLFPEGVLKAFCQRLM